MTLQINIGDHTSSEPDYIAVPDRLLSTARWARTKARWIAANLPSADVYFGSLPNGRTLTDEHYRSQLELRANLCLVDPRKLGDARYLDNDTFNAQLRLADLVVGTRGLRRLSPSVSQCSGSEDQGCRRIPVGGYTSALGNVEARVRTWKGLWVVGYANDACSYIPSARVLKEGGYEAADSMWYYDLPTSFAPEIEDRIVGKVRQQLKR